MKMKKIGPKGGGGAKILLSRFATEYYPEYYPKYYTEYHFAIVYLPNICLKLFLVLTSLKIGSQT